MIMRLHTNFHFKNLQMKILDLASLYEIKPQIELWLY